MILTRWIATTILSGALITPVYWWFERDTFVPSPKRVFVTQPLGESVSIDIPVENIAAAIPNFTMRTEVRTRRGVLIKDTDTIQYKRGTQYKFLTSSSMDLGSYETSLFVEYRLNPMRSSELEFPLAIIYVEDQSPAPTESIP